MDDDFDRWLSAELSDEAAPALPDGFAAAVGMRVRRARLLLTVKRYVAIAAVTLAAAILAPLAWGVVAEGARLAGAPVHSLPGAVAFATLATLVVLLFREALSRAMRG